MDRFPTSSRPQLTRRSIGALLAASCVPWSATIAQTLAARAHERDLGVIRGLLQQSEADIDLAVAKVTIDHLIDPTIDAAATLANLNAMARALKALLPIVASKRLTLDALRYHVYQASPWNGNRPFRYDLDDPFGTNIQNKLLSTYLASRKGNCVSMPFLFIILGQKLGVDLTAATAPNHIFVKYRDEGGTQYYLEATSGAGFARDVWIRQQFPMSDESLASGIYMRALTKKETVALMAGTLLEYYGQQEDPQLQDQRIALANIVLEYSPRDIEAILHLRAAILWMTNLIIDQHSYPNIMPADKRKQIAQAQAVVGGLFGRAYNLGWRPPGQAAEAAYRQTITRERAAQQK